MVNNFMLWNLPIKDDIEAKRSVFGRFITWNYKNTSIKRILMRLNRLHVIILVKSSLQLRFGMYQSIAMTSHNALVCSNSSSTSTCSIDWLTSTIIDINPKTKTIHSWMINNFMLWNLPITDDIEAKRFVFGRFITCNYKNTSIKRILMRLNRLHCHNTCWMLIAVTIWNVPEHCNDVTQCFGLFQFVDTMINK